MPIVKFIFLTPIPLSPHSTPINKEYADIYPKFSESSFLRLFS